MTNNSKKLDIIERIKLHLGTAPEVPATLGDLSKEDGVIVLGIIPPHLRSIITLCDELRQECNIAMEEEDQVMLYNQHRSLMYLVTTALIQSFPQMDKYRDFAVGQQWELIVKASSPLEDLFRDVHNTSYAPMGNC